MAYTLGSSGESLIWGNSDGSLTFPKKYFAFKHFTLAAAGGTQRVTKCGQNDLPQVPCLKFGEHTAVFVNTLNSTVHWDNVVECVKGSFCCTSEENDWFCSENDGTEVQPRTICSCKL